jgi:hypothetical protein
MLNRAFEAHMNNPSIPPRECPECKNGWRIIHVQDSTSRHGFRLEAKRCPCQLSVVPVMDAKMAAAGESAA